MTGSELVDYDRVADLYKAGRAMPDEARDRWGAAVRPHLPAGERVRVADVGAGTGIFAGAWAAWGGVRCGCRRGVGRHGGARLQCGALRAGRR